MIYKDISFLLTFNELEFTPTEFPQLPDHFYFIRINVVEKSAQICHIHNHTNITQLNNSFHRSKNLQIHASTKNHNASLPTIPVILRSIHSRNWD